MPYQLSCSVKRSLPQNVVPHHSYELYFLNQNAQQTYALLLVLASTLALGDVNARTHKKPNIVFILTDDQDRVLTSNVSVHVRDGGYGTMGSLEVMTSLRTKLMEKGASFENFFVNTPICCPSRTQFFTGRYFHNSISKGKGSCMHANTSLVSSPKTGLLECSRNAADTTRAYSAKSQTTKRTFCRSLARKESVSYIDSPLDYNNYMGATYFRYNAAVNKSTWVETLDKKQPIFGTNYQTTQIGNRTLRWLDGAIKESKEAAGRPFFAYVGPHAPHFPAMPAPYDEHAFDHLEMNPTKNYNYLCQKKAQHVAQNPALNERARCWENAHFRNRWASLLQVDRVIDAVVNKLEAEGVIDDTYIVFSSDHGYHLGQFRIGSSKQHPYETDVRVPLLIRGPNVVAASTPKQITGNIDVAPTLLNLAGISPSPTQDGKTLANILAAKKRLRFVKYF